MPPVRAHTRQDALSCQNCRGRKLKCDRQRPSCSNCQSRGLECEYMVNANGFDSPAGADHMAPSTRAGISKSVEPMQDHYDLGAENRQMKAEHRALAARLEKLEQSVSRHRAFHVPITQNDSATHATGPIAHASALLPSAFSAIDQGDAADRDLNWLETAGSNSGNEPNLHCVEVCTLEQIVTGKSERPRRHIVSVPSHDVAAACLDNYAQYLDAFQPIMHIKSTKLMIQDAYSHSYSQVQPVLSSGVLALILSLCATVSFHYTSGFYGSLIFLLGDNMKALKCSTKWTEEALSVIEHSRDAASATLETLQATILLIFLFCESEGVSYRVRRMHASSIAMARDLGLHNIDRPGIRAREETQGEIMTTEMRRRIWWYLTCTDWIMSMVGGPQEGHYSIQPQHMSVRMPRHIEADDLETKDARFERSLAEPTMMSYYLQRAKLSIICREISDMLYSVSDAHLVDYDLIEHLDAKFETQLQELPHYLRFDLSNVQLRSEYGEAFDDRIGMQRMAVHVMINIKRCKLHLPYLIRVKANPKFAFSRRASLQAARAVFNVRRAVLGEDDPASTAFLKQGGMLQHLFFATVVLVMDLCVNRTENGYDAGQNAEVRQALKVIEEGTKSSLAGKQYLDSLQGVMEKHRVRLRPTGGCGQPGFDLTNTGRTVGTIETDSSTDASQSAARPRSVSPAHSLDGITAGGIGFSSPTWNDFFEQATAWDVQAWSAVVNDLDMRMT